MGVVKNKSRAHMFFYMASLKGEQAAIKNLALIKDEISADELKLAKQLTIEWMDNYP